MTKITICPVAGTELHRVLPGQHQPQPCHVELDCRTGYLSAESNPIVGNAVPWAVCAGHVLRWSIPALRANSANELLKQIEPFAAKVVRGYSSAFNGEGRVVSKFSKQANEACDEIRDLCQRAYDLDSYEELIVWEAAVWLRADRPKQRKKLALELGLTAASTDEQIVALAAGLRAEAFPEGVDVIDGLEDHLRTLRNELRTEETGNAEG